MRLIAGLPLPPDVVAKVAEADRLRKLFDDAGQGEHNVLALIDHYQRNSMEADERLRVVRGLLEENGCDCVRPPPGRARARLRSVPRVSHRRGGQEVSSCRATNANPAHATWRAATAGAKARAEVKL